MAPFRALKGIERRQGEIGAGRAVDRTERGGEWLALFPVRKVETLTQQVHDARLQGRLRKQSRLASALALAALRATGLVWLPLHWPSATAITLGPDSVLAFRMTSQMRLQEFSTVV